MTTAQQEKAIIERAEKLGLKDDYFFTTTFQRYKTLVRTLKTLEKSIKADGAIVTKEYVKGRGNVYTHPAVAEYNRVSTAANNTVTTLLKMFAQHGDADDNEIDPLAEEFK